MTQSCEESLIRDVGKLNGEFSRFLSEWDAMKGDLVKRSDVDALEKKIDSHLDSHIDNKTLVAAWVGILSSMAIGIYNGLASLKG